MVVVIYLSDRHTSTVIVILTDTAKLIQTNSKTTRIKEENTTISLLASSQSIEAHRDPGKADR